MFSNGYAIPSRNAFHYSLAALLLPPESRSVARFLASGIEMANHLLLVICNIPTLDLQHAEPARVLQGLEKVESRAKQGLAFGTLGGFRFQSEALSENHGSACWLVVVR